MQYSVVKYKMVKTNKLPDVVVEKFIEWAKGEKLSF